MNAATTLAALETQAFALMGRLHVALRRQTGRVTDIEYMRIDPAYCRHVLDLAARMPNDDMHDICAKLEEVYFGPDGLFVRTPPKPPLLARIIAPPAPPTPPVMQPLPPPVNMAPEPAAPAADPASQDHGALVDQGYIGRLR